MRQEFHPVKTRAEAKRLMPWACKIARVEGGYRGWESVGDYETWRKQR
jgi:hypothetical protein